MTDLSSSETLRIEPLLDMDTDTTAWAQALVQRPQSVIFSRAGTAALQALSERLQSACHNLAPAARILHFSARQPARLLGHINEGLSLQGLAPAMQPRADNIPQDIWFVHDAQALAPDEWQLLLRLNGLFPGWPLRWVLLVDSLQPLSTDQQAVLDAQSGQWRWCDATKAGTPNPSLQGTPAPPEQVIRATAEPSKFTPAAGARDRQPLVLASLLLLGLLALGAWVVSQRAAQGPDLARPVTEAPSQAPVALSASDLAKVATVVSVPADPPGETPGPQASANAAPSTATGSTAPVAAEASPPPPLPDPPLPEVVHRDLRWLSSLPQDSYVLERGVFDTLQQAQRLINAQDELRSARIIMLRPGPSGVSRFVVVSGPFRSLERAQNFRIRLQLPSQSPIEQVNLLLEKSMPLKSDR